MKSRWIGLISLFILAGCGQEKAFTFQEVSCNSLSMVYAHYQIFAPCKTFTFRAKYWDENYQLISESLVRFTTSGDPVPDGVLREQSAIAQYEYEEEEILNVQQYNINDELEGRNWIDQINIGVYESDLDVWMQPFRENQFVFTQAAPYPSVNLPLEVGKQWTSNLIIYEGWGDWNNQQLISSYEVVEQGLTKVEFGDLKGTWHVTSTLDAGFGISTHDFWFHEVYGFVKMQYKNYAGQLAVFELVSID